MIDLKRIEFVMTYACSGKCKHCSVGDKIRTAGTHINYEKMKGTIGALGNKYNLESIMCFGGEPLLYYKDVEGIINEATISGIPKRQIITNGYFSKEPPVIADVVFSLEETGVTSILLSVDSFHQETIPLKPVMEFARLVKEGNVIDIKLHPAWVADIWADNDWNNKTKEVLKKFEDLNIEISKGNIIFPGGNAAKYLRKYYPKKEINLDFRCGQAKYTPDLENVDTIIIMPNGDVNICCIKIGNIYTEDVIDIMDRYEPYDNEIIANLLHGGVKGLMEWGREKGVDIDLTGHSSACSVCREIVEKLC